jgi:hypothetical protein
VNAPYDETIAPTTIQATTMLKAGLVALFLRVVRCGRLRQSARGHPLRRLDARRPHRQYCNPPLPAGQLILEEEHHVAYR